MRHFWFTDDNEEVMADHRGNIRGAISKAEEYLNDHPECEAIYINEGEDIVEVVWNKEEKNMTYPTYCYSKDMNNNCTIIKWGESGYYQTDFPEGKYTDDVIDEMNAHAGITKEMRDAMVMCSMASSFNPDLDWESHYTMCLEMKGGR